MNPPNGIGAALARGGETERLLQSSVLAFVERESDVRRGRLTRAQSRGFESEIWKRMARNGWLGITCPESCGGSGLGPECAAIVLEALGRAAAPEPVVGCAFLPVHLLAGSDDRRLAETLAARICAGEDRPAIAFQEAPNQPPAASEDAKLHTTVTGTSKPRLEGRKRFVLGGEQATGFIVLAERPGVGPVLVWTEGEAPGLERRLEDTVDGLAFANLTFDATPCTPLTEGGPATRSLLEAALDEARLLVSAEIVGVMCGALELTLDYVRQREQFGQPIGRFQVIQHRLVDLWIQTELASSSVLRGLGVCAAGADRQARARAASAAKARAAEAALAVCKQGIQLHGAMGYTAACDVGLYLKRALLLASWLGNARWYRRRFAALAAPGR